MKGIRIIFIVVFLGLIYFPAINNHFGFIREPVEEILPSPPSPDINKLDDFPKLYEKYYDKTFAIKPWLVKLNSLFKIAMLHVSPDPDRVVIGRNGWLYLAERNIKTYEGSNLFTKAELQKIKNNLDERALHAKRNKKAAFYFVPLPLKHTIYPEYLPASVRKKNPETCTDQIIQYLKDDTLVKVIDLRSELMAAKSAHILYYKTDNHWNDIGGYYAYRKIISEINKDFPAVTAIDTSHFVLDSIQPLVGGEALMLNAGNLFHEVRYDYYGGSGYKAHKGIKKGYPPPKDFIYPEDYEIVTETGDSLLPDALFIRDSFCDAMLPFLCENFNHAVFIFDSWLYRPNYTIVDNEQPDIVMYLVMESNLDRILSNE